MATKKLPRGAKAAFIRTFGRDIQPAVIIDAGKKEGMEITHSQIVSARLLRKNGNGHATKTKPLSNGKASSSGEEGPVIQFLQLASKLGVERSTKLLQLLGELRG